MTNPTPDFRTELARLVDLYYALGGNWSPHGYTDTWNDALASARIALATPPPEPPTDEELLKLTEKVSTKHLCAHKSLPSDWDFGDYSSSTKGLIDFARAVLERWGK